MMHRFLKKILFESICFACEFGLQTLKAKGLQVFSRVFSYRLQLSSSMRNPLRKHNTPTQCFLQHAKLIYSNNCLLLLNQKIGHLKVRVRVDFSVPRFLGSRKNKEAKVVNWGVQISVFCIVWYLCDAPFLGSSPWPCALLLFLNNLEKTTKYKLVSNNIYFLDIISSYSTYKGGP